MSIAEKASEQIAAINFQLEGGDGSSDAAGAVGINTKRWCHTQMRCSFPSSHALSIFIFNGSRFSLRSFACGVVDESSLSQCPWVRKIESDGSTLETKDAGHH